MLKRSTILITSVLALFFSYSGSAIAADKTSKYRVYQDDRILVETSDYKSAENAARQYTSTHVEEISTRNWLWNNYPRYKVYQNGLTSPAWDFTTLDQAIREASNWGHASVRDLQGDAWVWNNYPKYRLYQGDTSMDSWEFATLSEAQSEAKKWSNTHIIDLRDHRWVWDNITETTKSELRAGSRIYQVYQGKSTMDSWSFAYLEDAINESLRWGNSSVVNTQKNSQVVFPNEKPYKVYQFSTILDSFLNIDDAIAYAKQFDHTTIYNEASGQSGTTRGIWTNYPYYQVFQNNNWIADFSDLPAAASYALAYSNTTIRLLDGGLKVWDNFRNLQFWGWNGSSNNDTIRGHVNNTVGLDVVSPTYFTLADSSGTLTDTSNADTVAWLKSQGIKVQPLVNNQFSGPLTSQFLANPDGQNKFIQALVNKGVALGVDGLNIDFESLSGKDRAAFTAFMTNLTNAAHAQGLTISIDLPRGSAKWNAQTAYDHEKLGQIVDYIVTMAYDQYWKGSTEPGSVAGLQWVEEGVKEFLSYGIPRDKLIMGMPFYVREWQVDENGQLVDTRALFMKDLPALITNKKATMTWDDRFGQYKVEYMQDGNKRVFWLENEDTIKARLEIAKKYDIGGVAAWRLGYDSASLWKMMIQEK